MQMTNPDGTFTVAHMVHLARRAVGYGSKRDTPSHILRHRIRKLELVGVVPTEAERAEILREAELQIARDQFENARERLVKAELAAEMAKAKRARPALEVVR